MGLTVDIIAWETSFVWHLKLSYLKKTHLTVSVINGFVFNFPWKIRQFPIIFGILKNLFLRTLNVFAFCPLSLFFFQSLT